MRCSALHKLHEWHRLLDWPHPGPASMAAAVDPWFVVLGVCGVGVVKALGGLVALALVQPWGMSSLSLRPGNWSAQR